MSRTTPTKRVGTSDAELLGGNVDSVVAVIEEPVVGAFPLPVIFDAPWKPEGSRRPDSSRVPTGYRMALRDLPPELQAMFLGSIDNPPEPYAVVHGDPVTRFAFRVSDRTAERFGIAPTVVMRVISFDNDERVGGAIGIYWDHRGSKSEGEIYDGHDVSFFLHDDWAEVPEEAIDWPGAVMLELLEHALSGEREGEA